MLEQLFTLAGWTGIGAFFSRFLVQWFAAERARRSITPRSFWTLSLIGTAGLGTYSAWRGEYLLLGGILINGVVFARNLLLAKGRERIGTSGRIAGASLAALLIASGVMVQVVAARPDGFWLACVLLGQLVWSSRFVVQWWIAERDGEGVLSPAFWWASLFGNTLLLCYALHLADPVYVAGFLLGPIVQVRNLLLHHRQTA